MIGVLTARRQDGMNGQFELTTLMAKYKTN